MTVHHRCEARRLAGQTSVWRPPICAAMMRWVGIMAVASMGSCACIELLPRNPQTAASTPPQAVARALAPFLQEIPGTAYKFEMLPVPGDASHGIAPFWIAKTETTWDAFDVFVFRLDEEPSTAAGSSHQSADAVTRPSKPYLPPDRGFGHEGFAAISMSFRNASECCTWLSAKTRRHYRLPTEMEWEWACRAGSSGAYSFGDDVARLADYAWFKDNADNVPHEGGKKRPNAWGLFDMHGNVA